MALIALGAILVFGETGGQLLGVPERAAGAAWKPPVGVMRISGGGGCQPIWRKDGKELFYLTLDGKLISVEMQSEILQPLRARKLFASRVRVYGGFAQYAADAAGEQFLMIEPETEAEPPESAEPIHVVTNWAARPRD